VLGDGDEVGSARGASSFKSGLLKLFITVLSFDIKLFSSRVSASRSVVNVRFNSTEWCRTLYLIRSCDELWVVSIDILLQAFGGDLFLLLQLSK